MRSPVLRVPGPPCPDSSWGFCFHCSLPVFVGAAAFLFSRCVHTSGYLLSTKGPQESSLPLERFPETPVTFTHTCLVFTAVIKKNTSTKSNLREKGVYLSLKFQGAFHHCWGIESHPQPRAEEKRARSRSMACLLCWARFPHLFHSSGHPA